jgi:hypothetical protein
LQALPLAHQLLPEGYKCHPASITTGKVPTTSISQSALLLLLPLPPGVLPMLAIAASILLL